MLVNKTVEDMENTDNSALQEPKQVQSSDDIGLSCCERNSNFPLPSVTNIHNPFAYLERNEFTSEKFKIEIRNLPKHYGLRELKKLLNNKLKLKTNKIKIPGKSSFWIYVCFRSEEDKNNAIKTLNGYKWKGNILSADTAQAIPDPLVKRKMLDQQNNEGSQKRFKINEESECEKLRNATTPLWRLPYEKQICQKEESVNQLMKELGIELARANPNLTEYIESQNEKYNGLPCDVWSMRYAELTPDGYRNKCEFTIGMNDMSGLKTIGFRLGSYAKGSVCVAPIENALNVPKRMKEVVLAFQDFIRSSEFDVFHPVTQEGYWRQMTIRYGFRTDQLMVVIGVNSPKISSLQLETLSTVVKEFFSSGEGKACNITSLYIQLLDKKKSHEDKAIYHHLLGDTHIYEKILNRTFRISPQTFFQINTNAAEILYSSIAELADLNENVALLDVCCGSGSIGICLSDKCGEVLGLEISAEAVEDAKENARANNIENTQFFAGKAEEILSSVAFKTTKDNIVAIVDPPRAGLHLSALVQIRKSNLINKLVYVSCDPKLALENFVTLGRATSKMYQREPFVPVKAVPVDLFPHTNHCELLIYFERVLSDS